MAAEVLREFGNCRAALMAKLSPNVPDIGLIARAVAEAGADA